MDVCVPPGAKWPISYAEYQSLDPYQRDLAEAFAWSLLASLTAFQIGTCPITVRPCASRCTPGGIQTYPVYAAGTWMPYISGGRWLNACGCETGCGCTRLSEVDLPGPVGKIVEVLQDGVALDPSAYRLDNGHLLVRTDGGEWPVCQDLALDSDQPGTFAVTYYRGAAPNDMTKFVAGVLAHEFYLGWTDEAKCRLPWNVTQVTRQGTSYELEPPSFPDGTTGIFEVDSFVSLVNPNRIKMPVSIASPETVRRAPRHGSRR